MRCVIKGVHCSTNQNVWKYTDSVYICTVKPVLSDYSKRRPKIRFKDWLWLNAGHKCCRMLQESILQYFRPSLGYHLSLRPWCYLFLSGCLRLNLLYVIVRCFQLNIFITRKICKDQCKHIFAIYEQSSS